MPKYRQKIYDFMEAVKNKDTVGELWICGDIVDEKWYDDDVTPNIVRNALDAMGDIKSIDLHINSYGGSVVAGNAIIDVIDAYRRKTGVAVNTYIDGMAASMASGVAMAGDKIYMAQNSMFMVHKPYTMAIGNTDDLEHEKYVLEKVEDTLVSNYMRHFNGTEDELRQLMADETWLTAEEAKSYGFCDEIIAPIQIAASAKGLMINGVEFKNIDSIKSKILNLGKEDTHMEYNEELAKFGVTEDMFAGLQIPADAALTLSNAIAENCRNYLNSAFWEYRNGSITNVTTGDSAWGSVSIPFSPAEEFISAEQAKNALGADVDAQTVLDLAVKGQKFDAEAHSKAKAYDNLVKQAIDEAVKKGIQAKGEAFNESKWRKILNALDYDEIIDQGKEWAEDAKNALHAGQRVSGQKNITDGQEINTKDYDF